MKDSLESLRAWRHPDLLAGVRLCHGSLSEDGVQYLTSLALLLAGSCLPVAVCHVRRLRSVRLAWLQSRLWGLLDLTRCRHSRWSCLEWNMILQLTG